MKKKLNPAANTKSLWDGEFNVFVDKTLNKRKGQNPASDKLELANKNLSKMKSLPK